MGNKAKAERLVDYKKSGFRILLWVNSVLSHRPTFSSPDSTVGGRF
jgi:hypothetical protein